MKIERRPYSRKPWRLVTSKGAEIYVRQAFDHPDLGATVIDGPVCGDTKAECTDAALAILETLLRKTAPALAA